MLPNIRRWICTRKDESSPRDNSDEKSVFESESSVMPTETLNQQLTVYVNDRPKRLFHGLKVKHAIGARNANAVREHRAVVRDGDGNQVDVDGALYDGERLYLTSMDPTSFADE